MLDSIALSQEKLIPAWLQPVVALDLLSARNVKLTSVLNGSALFPDALPFTYHYINPWHFERLLYNAHRQWPGEDFCFQLGHRIAEQGCGPLHDVLDCNMPLAQWLTTAHRHQRLLTPSLSTRLYRVGESDQFLLFGGVAGHRASPLALRSGLTTIIHWLKRSALTVSIDVFLRTPKPADIELFHVHIPARCHFDAPFDGLRIQSRAASPDTPPLNLRAQVAERHCLALHGEKEYLLNALTRLLWSPHAEPPCLQNCAEQMQTSPATLKRRLRDTNCSFQQLSDTVRSERAVIELLISGASVEQVGARLHFHDSSNFRRAFKRWTGMTPRSLQAAWGLVVGGGAPDARR